MSKRTKRITYVAGNGLSANDIKTIRTRGNTVERQQSGSNDHNCLITSMVEYRGRLYQLIERRHLGRREVGGAPMHTATHLLAEAV